MIGLEEKETDTTEEGEEEEEGFQDEAKGGKISFLSAVLESREAGMRRRQRAPHKRAVQLVQVKKRAQRFP